MSRRLVLVTGGAGFIGSNIVATLAADPSINVVACDRLRTAASGKWRNLAKHPIMDFIAPEDLSDWLAGRGAAVEIVIHMGAISSTSEPDADRIITTNFGLSRDLFAWCSEHRRRFIWASSAATYGDGTGGFDDAPEIAALAALRPLNAYGWSKALFDLHAARHIERGNAPLQWVGLKFFNVYGPNEGHKGGMRSVACNIWPDAAAGRPVKLFRSHNPDFPDGGQRRDFVYVLDVADVVAWLVGRSHVSGLFNLGSGEARTFKDLAAAVYRAAGRDMEIAFVETPPELRAHYQYFTEAKMERLRGAGFDRPFAPLEEGVGDYVNRYLSRADPYR